MSQRITIDPITRLEGHGKIEIFLDDQGEVANAYLQIPELRGFERFCLGRAAEEMDVAARHFVAEVRVRAAHANPLVAALVPIGDRADDAVRLQALLGFPIAGDPLRQRGI